MINPRLLPTTMIILSILAAIIYGLQGDIRRTCYWVASAVLINSVTY
jgi:hypothetical protein